MPGIIEYYIILRHGWRWLNGIQEVEEEDTPEEKRKEGKAELGFPSFFKSKRR
jgi:hypothetical protein